MAITLTPLYGSPPPSSPGVDDKSTIHDPDPDNSLIDQLHQDTRIITLFAKGDSRPFHIQRTWIAKASPKLAKLLTVDTYSIDITYEGLRVFLIFWLLGSDIKECACVQLALAQAWRFGEHYQIPDLQNKAIHALLDRLDYEYLDPDAVVEAYSIQSRHNPLRKMLVARLVYDRNKNDVDACETSELESSGLLDRLEFLQDMTIAMWNLHANEPVLPQGEEPIVRE